MTSIAYAMGQQPAGSQGAGGGWVSLLPMVLIFIIFYALLILPQQKKQKKHLEMLRSLKRGDEVVTTGGLHGSVVGLDEKRDVAVLKIADNVKVEVDRGSISRVKSPGS